jgi:hypothetical protein
MNIAARNVRVQAVPLVNAEGETKINHVRVEFDLFHIGGDEALIASKAHIDLDVGNEEFAKLFETTYHLRQADRKAINEAVKQ